MNKYAKVSAILLVLMVIVFFAEAHEIDPKPEKLQSMVKSAISKGYRASVSITEYDTTAKRAFGGKFSGVIVTSSGVILTAGHAARTGKVYMVTFPDNTQYVAIGAGRIVLLDAAMMKIKEEGIYPFAELGWSSSMKINEPCISIAYPASFNPNRLVIRLGQVVAHDV